MSEIDLAEHDAEIARMVARAGEQMAPGRDPLSVAYALGCISGIVGVNLAFDRSFALVSDAPPLPRVKQLIIAAGRKFDVLRLRSEPGKWLLAVTDSAGTWPAQREVAGEEDGDAPA